MQYLFAKIGPNWTSFLIHVWHLLRALKCLACCLASEFNSTKPKKFIVNCRKSSMSKVISSYNLFTRKIEKNSFCRKIDVQSISDGETLRMYEIIEEKCCKYSKKMAYFIKANFGTSIISLLYSFYCLGIGNYDASTWILAFDFTLFKTNIIWKWYLIWFYELSINYVYAAITTSIPAYFVSCCLYISGICDHFDSFIESLRSVSQQNPTENHKTSATISEQLCNAIKIQIKALE